LLSFASLFTATIKESFVLTSTKAPSAVKMRVFGPLLHLPKQFTLTTGTEAGVRKVKVAIVASDPFSRHLLK
jgi:hypothetical protein